MGFHPCFDPESFKCKRGDNGNWLLDRSARSDSFNIFFPKIESRYTWGCFFFFFVCPLIYMTQLIKIFSQAEGRKKVSIYVLGSTGRTYAAVSYVASESDRRSFVAPAPCTASFTGNALGSASGRFINGLFYSRNAPDSSCWGFDPLVCHRHWSKLASCPPPFCFFFF